VAAAEVVATTAEEAAAAALAAAALATEMEAAMTASVDAARPGNGNVHSRRLERRAAERRRQREEAVETAVALEEPFEEPGAYLEVEEPGAGSLLGGQGGRGELEAGGTPLTFDPGKTRPPPDTEDRSSTRRPPGH
jgi:hypothetical protein